MVCPPIMLAKRQFRYFLRIYFLRLKGAKFLWLLPLIACLLSNNFIYVPLAQLIGFYGKKFVDIKQAHNFASDNEVLTQTDRYIGEVAAMDAVLRELGTRSSDPSLLFKQCQSPEDCNAQHFNRLYSNSPGGYVSQVDFKPNDPLIVCLLETGAEIYCPFLGYLASIGRTKDPHTKLRFKAIRMFRAVGQHQRDSHHSSSEGRTMCHLERNFADILPVLTAGQSFLSVGMMHFYFLVATLSCIYDLKGNGLLQLLVQKGLSVRAYWLVICLVAAVEVLFGATVFTVSLAAQCPNFYQSAALAKVFGHCALQFLCIAAACLLVSVTVGRYGKAGLALGLIAVLGMIINLINSVLLSDQKAARTALLLLHPPGQLGDVVQTILLTDSSKVPPAGYATLAFASPAIHTICYICLALYLDFVLASGNGLCLSAGYILQSDFWCRSKSDGSLGEVPELTTPLANIEPIKEDLRPVVTMSNMSKSLPTGCYGINHRENEERNLILDNISVTIYESQITAIIGHNGAGKSTLLKIISGEERPTSGWVCIDGWHTDSSVTPLRLRGQLGICSQRNCLSNSLTVRQTIDLTLISCGMYPDQETEELDDILELLRLRVKLMSSVGTLSGGQKRKLSIALALLGNPRVVILDEPTNGVDPVSRRRIWKLLQERKHGCAILLSTQFMDEADTLADRKILLSAGSIICCGSSLFLKNVFDSGFIFEVSVKSPELIPTLLKRIADEFRTIRLKKQFRNNLELQVSANELELLPTFAAFLEKRVDLIAAYGLAQPTLADIFIRLKDFDPKQILKLFETKTVSLLASETNQAESLSSIVNQPKGNALDTLEARVLAPSVTKRFNAILTINIRRIYRTRAKLCLRLIVPVLLLVCVAAAAIVESVTRNRNQQSRRVLHYRNMQFNKGVCVFDSPSSKNKKEPTADDCAKLFNAKSSSGFKVLSKVQVTGIDGFLEQDDVIDMMKQYCDGSTEEKVCPVFHTDVWSTSVPNAKREASIGLYSVSPIYNSTVIAATIMSAYSSVMNYFAGSSGGSKAQIRVEAVDDFKKTFLPLFGAFVQIIILSVLPATFMEDTVEDKEACVRSQLSSIGVSSAHYWATTFVVHWIQYAIIYIVSVILLVSILPHNFLNLFYTTGVFIPTLFFGLTNNLLFSYIVSSFLSNIQQFARISCLFFSLCVSASLLAVQLNSVAGMIMIYLLPPFASVALTFYGTKVYYFTNAYYWIDGEQAAPEGSSIYFAHMHVYNSLIAMVCHTGLLVILLVASENRHLALHRCQNLCQRSDETSYPQGEDPGVDEEIQRIEEHRHNQANLLEVRHIGKTYHPGRVKAVRDVTFGVTRGEIFGLLGPNGAGKTTTMSVIVGDQKPSRGECEIRAGEQWLKSCSAARLGAIGYCPQHNPLFPCITVAEHLFFYAKILGVHEGLAEKDVRTLLQGLDLESQADSCVSSLSEGAKRRTCLAIALLGNPSIVVIDEASTGVDPEGKRFIWSVIRSMANNKRALVITTHSMEEAEALCNRVGIMNHGLMVGLGSVAQLVSLYGEYYTLDIQIQSHLGEQPKAVRARKERAIKAILLHFHGSKVIEQFTTNVALSVPSESIPRLSVALSWLVTNREPLQLKYFSFYQLSLDQVFEYLLKSHDDQIQKQNRLSVFSVTTQLSEFDNSAFV
ncbi:hypothetical protein BOX15_Mlig009542g3 [Macrostomum lignano]|uniref:ABC transporter domain-containing protein n=1 Tax=Macrostomum lignano TaxID=282301 RepID=A0A267FJ80_9PLAT|nr:hypothetical protein BOX15_Mlig009542g3 [Macrostomum lignano]